MRPGRIALAHLDTGQVSQFPAVTTYFASGVAVDSTTHRALIPSNDSFGMYDLAGAQLAPFQYRTIWLGGWASGNGHPPRRSTALTIQWRRRLHPPRWHAGARAPSPQPIAATERAMPLARCGSRSSSAAMSRCD